AHPGTQGPPGARGQTRLDVPVSGPTNDRWQEVEAALAEAMRTERARPAKRERVVIGGGRGPSRVVRPLDDVEQLTEAGEEMVGELVRTQLTLALTLMVFTAMVLGAIPLVFLLVPSLGTTSIFGLRLPWLLLGLAVYPLFIAVAWFYNHRADRNEQKFIEKVEN
ncbi:MAG: hypothetical protein ACRDTF_24015, partial [Pseudonocardiaceae bacterium]